MSVQLVILGVGYQQMPATSDLVDFAESSEAQRSVRHITEMVSALGIVVVSGTSGTVGGNCLRHFGESEYRSHGRTHHDQ